MASHPGIMKQRMVVRKPLRLPIVFHHIMHGFDHVYALSTSLTFMQIDKGRETSLHLLFKPPPTHVRHLKV